FFESLYSEILYNKTRLGVGLDVLIGECLELLVLEDGGSDGEVLLEVGLGLVGERLELLKSGEGLNVELIKSGLVSGNDIGLDLAGVSDNLLDEGLGLGSECVDLLLEESVELLGLLVKSGRLLLERVESLNRSLVAGVVGADLLEHLLVFLSELGDELLDLFGDHVLVLGGDVIDGVDGGGEGADGDEGQESDGAEHTWRR
ncbi:hypothetical protein PMAYCL1PPCAC_10297, partial [Pristionchus mayeri]